MIASHTALVVEPACDKSSDIFSLLCQEVNGLLVQYYFIIVIIIYFYYHHFIVLL